MMPPSTKEATHGRVFARWPDTLLLLLLLVIGNAVWSHQLFETTRASYLNRIAVVGLVLGLAMLSLSFLRRANRVNAVWIPVVPLLLASVGFASYAGSGAAFSIAVLALVALGLGGRLCACLAPSVSMRLAIGLALIAAVTGWLLPFPIHDGRLYLVAAGLIILACRQIIQAQLTQAATGWTQLAHEHPAWLTLATFTAALASLSLWLPSVSYDDNAAHLILPAQLLADGYYRLDVSSQAWAVAPWSNNVLHGVAALLAHEEVRPAIAGLWLLLGIAGAYRLARSIGAEKSLALAAAAIFASQPLTAYYGMVMQVDGASAAVLLHLAALLVADKGRLTAPMAMGALFGLLAGLKVSNIVFAFLPLVWLGLHGLRHGTWRRLALMLLVAALVGGSSYFYAAWITGNPVFPLFNGIFHSPYLPANDFHDTRWDSGVDWRVLWDLTFDTTRFGEHYPGAAGLTLLALSPGLLPILYRPGAARWLTLWLVIAGGLMFWQIQYLRYIFPAIAVLATLGVVGLGTVCGHRALAVFITFLVAANVLLMPTTSWIARDDPWQQLLSEGASAKLDIVRSVIPEKALLARIHADDRQACPLMVDASFVGGFAERTRVMAWYDARLLEARRWADADDSGVRWQKLLRQVGVSHLILQHQSGTPLMTALLAEDYVRMDRQARVEVWAARERGARRCSDRLQRQRDEAIRHFRIGTQP